MIKPDTVRNILKRDVLPRLTSRFPSKGDDPGIAAGRIHSFRHYFCSISADHGVAEQLLMSWLGHRESDMIKHYYYHQQQDESRRQMDKIPFLIKPADDGGDEQWVPRRPTASCGWGGTVTGEESPGRLPRIGTRSVVMMTSDGSGGIVPPGSRESRVRGTK